MIKNISANREKMRTAAQKGFINANGLADYLVPKGIPFGTTYKKVGEIVAYCMDNGLILDTVPIEKGKYFCPLFDED